MKEKSFEESQLSDNMLELCFIALELNKELDCIYRELYNKGKWDDFIMDLDKVEAKKGKIIDIVPANYYESLNFVFNIIDRYTDFRDSAEIMLSEAELLRGINMENILMPEDNIRDLESLGIIIQPGRSQAAPISDESLQEKICASYTKSRIMISRMNKALDALRESKSFILSQYS